MYSINVNQHSPLIGFAYDGYPIYGAYAYANANGTGGIVRMKSSFQLRNITTRTTLYTGATVTAGPAVSVTYPLGYFKEDYEFVSHPNDASYLDIHNGRFCVTPEYPNGTYCYFATVDANHNSAYPYVVGPTFYGVKTASKVTTITEATTTLSSILFNPDKLNTIVFPNPASDFFAVQVPIALQDMKVELLDTLGKVIQTQTLYQGSTMCYFDVQTLYAGVYFVRIANENKNTSTKIIIK